MACSRVRAGMGDESEGGEGIEWEKREGARRGTRWAVIVLRVVKRGKRARERMLKLDEKAEGKKGKRANRERRRHLHFHPHLPVRTVVHLTLLLPLSLPVALPSFPVLFSLTCPRPSLPLPSISFNTTSVTLETVKMVRPFPGHMALKDFKARQAVAGSFPLLRLMNSSPPLPRLPRSNRARRVD